MDWIFRDPRALFTEEETGCRYHDHCNPLEVVLLEFGHFEWPGIGFGFGSSYPIQ
jgi:hypothetical protein